MAGAPDSRSCAEEQASAGAYTGSCAPAMPDVSAGSCAPGGSEVARVTCAPSDTEAPTGAARAALYSWALGGVLWVFFWWAQAGSLLLDLSSDPTDVTATSQVAVVLVALAGPPLLLCALISSGYLLYNAVRTACLGTRILMIIAIAALAILACLVFLAWLFGLALFS